ncbi:hypothetical protein [Nocardia sp. NPDC051832]|uniref:hypothetical protein n=1 Tax=Nocardia sp. NPDC051832 TaxID=3155673 RepID=UPI00341F3BEE
MSRALKDYVSGLAHAIKKGIAGLRDADSKGARNIWSHSDRTADPQGHRGDSQPDHRSPEATSPANDSNTPGTVAYAHRLDELAKDPAHGGKVTPKSRREAEVALGMERNGQLKPPVTRAQMDNGKDTGDFVDGVEQHWDMKQPTDTFPSTAGPKAGQPMPPTMRGVYNSLDFERMVADELDTGEMVMIDPQNLSAAGLQSVRQILAGHPEWAGKVVIYGY